MQLTREKKNKILQQRLQAELKALDAAIADAVARGASSVTYSTGDGSKSATFIALKELQAQRDAKAAQLASVTRALAHRPFFQIGHVMTTRS